jgi:Lon protease-like protein
MTEILATDPLPEKTIALFPLKSVLFPKGRLPLQIFEQRYIDLIRQSLRSDSGFGICLLKEGEEVARPGVQQQVHKIGTYAQVVDWDQLSNGLLGVTVEGQYKFAVEDCWPEENRLLMARVRGCETDRAGEPIIALGAEHEVLVGLLEQLVSHPVISKLGMDIVYHDLREVGWRLSELIPLSLETKQALLEMQDPHARVREIEHLINRMIDDA